MKMMKSALPTLFLGGGILFAFATTATAQRPHHAPPKEAFTACESHAAGDACTVTFGDHTLNGTCKKPKEDASAALACLPEHMGPPPAAVDACQGKAAGDTCSVTGPDGGSHDGSCATGPEPKGPLACRPARK